MDRSGATELRKLFSKYVEGDSAAGCVAGCIISTDRKIKGEFTEKVLKCEKKTILKYFTLFKKVLGNNNADITFKENDKKKDGTQFLLDKMNATDLSNKDINHILFEKVAEALPETGAYAVLALQYEYDIPVKDKNKEKMKSDAGEGGVFGTESEEVYKFFICAVCPVKVGKESLGYWEGKIGENPQFETIEAPEFGFLFPNFTDRSTDKDSLSCFRSDKLDISDGLFGQKAPEIIKEEPKIKKKDLKKAAKEDTNEDFEDTGTSFDEEPYDPPKTGNSPSSYTPGGSYEDTKPKKESKADYEDGMTESEIKAAMSLPRVGEKPVKITGDHNKISKRLIGDTEYWVVAVKDASVV